MRSLSFNTSLETRNAISHPDLRKKYAEEPLSESRYKWWESQEINLGSSINIFLENKPRKLEVNENELSSKNQKRSFGRKIVDFFDLTLLTDPIFVNILCGLSLAACVETNFSLLFPIILRDMMEFPTSDIATVMAVIGLTDTMFRFVSPFIGEWLKKSPRVMYMVSLLLIVFIRTSKL